MLKRAEQRILRLTILVPLMMLVGGWAGHAAAESLYDKIKRIGVFNAGVRADFPPIGTVDDSGNPIGFGPDLAKIFADKMGVKVKYTIVTSSASRIPLILNGGIDADIGLTTPTKQRNEQVDFTTPYIWDSVAMLVKKGASLKLADYAPPKKISIAQGSSIVDYVKEKLPNAELVQFQNPSDGAAALIQGKVDAFASNRYAVRARSRSSNRIMWSAMTVSLSIRFCDHRASGRFEMAQLVELHHAGDVAEGRLPETVREMVRRSAGMADLVGLPAAARHRPAVNARRRRAGIGGDSGGAAGWNSPGRGSSGAIARRCLAAS